MSGYDASNEGGNREAFAEYLELPLKDTLGPGAQNKGVDCGRGRGCKSRGLSSSHGKGA